MGVRGFSDRAEAGQLLAEKLLKYAGRDDVIVLGLPRGGVPVAFEVAKRLGAPLDVFIVRKLGVPGFEELAVGAIASGGVRVLNEDVARALPNADNIIEAVTARETAELKRREESYRDGRPAPELRNKIVILVDDGLATGATMRAAVQALRQRDVVKIVVAAPVGAPETCREFENEVDEIVCAMAPEYFQAVGQYYEDFSQTTDDEVRELLARAALAAAGPSEGGQDRSAEGRIRRGEQSQDRT
jgi:putative phosphoribosyl transferase